jgi:endoglucanase
MAKLLTLLLLAAFTLLPAFTAAQPVIYKDAQTLITGTWANAGSGGTYTFAEVTGETPHEGTKHYKFTYTFTAWWAGLGLNMDNWGNNPARDFSGYSHLRIAYRGLAGSQTFRIQLRNGNTYGNLVEIGPTASSYTVVDIPMIALTAGTNLQADAVREIDLSVGSVQAGSGTVYFDALELVNSSGGSSASPETWARANSLTIGVNTSNWLEAYWLIPFGTYPEVNKYTRTKIRDLHTAGFQVFRLPITVERITPTTPPYTIDFGHTAFRLVDSMILWTNLYNLKLIIDNHHGYNLTNANFAAELPRLKAIWGQLADHYDYLDPDKFFFEIYNEPTPDISNANWRTVANELVDEIRLHETQTHSVFVGANSWNSGTALVSFTPLDDEDIIYTFHCYDPYLFTHQGMSWTSPPNLPARTFPQAGEVAALNTLMQSVDDWSATYDVPASLGEYGCSTAADAASRCNWIEAITDAMDAHGFSNLYWDAITPSDAFGFFNGGIIDEAHVITCFADAIGLYSAPAPIALERFEAGCGGGQPQLAWSAYTVGAGYLFDIERSVDGRQWERAATVAASEGQRDYQFEDKKQGGFYRLNVIAPDGSSEYSPIRQSACAEAGAVVQVFPNPAVGQAQARLLQSDAAPFASATLFDWAGRALRKFNYSETEEEKTIDLPLHGLPAGTYLLRGRLADGSAWQAQVLVATR